jgi:ABC-type transport system substrate-binding protein
MKRIFSTFVILLSVLLSACASQQVQPAPSNTPAGLRPVTVESSTLTVGTPPTDSASVPPAGQTSTTITLDDNGKTFNFHVGDSFLLNLGDDVYDWTVNNDNQNVIALRMGVMVIKGAQGLFDARSPGTVTLTADGNPKCLNSTPACLRPSILFTVTLIVQ